MQDTDRQTAQNHQLHQNSATEKPYLIYKKDVEHQIVKEELQRSLTLVSFKVITIVDV